MPLSVMNGLLWWVSLLHQGHFKPLCSFLGRQKETFLSLVNHNLSLLSWCKPNLQSIDLGHGVTYYINTSFIEVTKVVIQNRMVLDMLTAVQGGTCAIIKVECCVYIPDLSGNVSAALDDMKNQVKAMSNENIPFWTSVLSCVKGDWWKTIFTIVIVALIVLLCGPFILQCIMNFVTQRLVSFSQIGSWRARVQYIPMNDAHTMS